jgi:hypothetical protein
MVNKKVVVIGLAVLILALFVFVLSSGVFSPTGGVIMTGGAIGGSDYGDGCFNKCSLNNCDGVQQGCVVEFNETCMEECKG